MSKATTLYPEKLKHFEVCVSVYHISCAMHILLICLVHAVDEVHLCVQMWPHVCARSFFLGGSFLSIFWKGEVRRTECRVSYGPFPAVDSLWI